MANFSFDKPFIKMFGKMNDALDEMVDEIKKFNVSDYEYGVCSTSYKIRFITPQNVSEYIDMLSKAFGKHLIETPGDIERFSVEIAKRMMKENGCEDLKTSSPMGYTPSNITYRTLMDVIAGLKEECFNRSCYSQFDMRQRQVSVQKDLEKITGMKFYMSMKNLVNGIPTVLQSSDVICKATDDVCDIIRESIEEFILFAFSVNMITVLQMKEYLIPQETYVTKKENEGGNTFVTECDMLKTTSADLRIRLPFSVNIRNIVLADNTTGFSDVCNAIKYITTNPASPVAEMISRFVSSEKKKEICNCAEHELSILGRLFSRCPGIESCKDCQSELTNFMPPNSNVQWYDAIANGNQFIDGAYRRDLQVTGNITQSSILDSMNMLYKIFNGCGCGLTTNEEIAQNIVRVSNLMKLVADRYDTIHNIELVREILAILGEILTRDIIMLVNNNTRVLDLSHLDDPEAGPPAYFYSESFIMEEEIAETPAKENTAPTPASKQNDADKVAVTYKNKDGEDKKVSARFQAFINWCRKVLSSISKKFNKDHDGEIKYVTKHEDLNNKIKTAIEQKKFVININNYPNFSIKLEQIKPDIDKVVTTWLDVKNKPEFNAKAFEASLYVGTEEQQKAIAAKNNANEKMEAISNVMLFNQVTKPQTYTGPVTAPLWEEMINDLKTSFNLIQAFVDNLSQSLVNASEKVKAAASTNIPDDAASTNPEAAQKKQRAQAMEKILMDLSTVYATATVNSLTKKFYSTTYNTYASLIKAYKQQTKDDAAQTAEQPPAEENTDNEGGNANG